MKKILFKIIFLIGVNYCQAQRFYSKEDQKDNLPKIEINFKLSKQLFTLNDTTLISTNSIYVHSDYLCGVKCDSMYFFIRFFSDGKMFWSFPYLSYPTENELVDLSYGKYGRYIIKEGKIKMELYMNRQHGMMYMFAKPVSNGIQFYKTTGRGIGQILKVSKTKDGGFYKKFKV